MWSYVFFEFPMLSIFQKYIQLTTAISTSRYLDMSTRFLWSRQNPYYFHIKFPAYLDIANSTPPAPLCRHTFLGILGTVRKISTYQIIKSQNWMFKMMKEERKILNSDTQSINKTEVTNDDIAMSLLIFLIQHCQGFLPFSTSK